MAIIAVTAVCLLMLRHLPTGTRESLGSASWHRPRRLPAGTGLRVFCFAFFDASILALLPLREVWIKGLMKGGGAAGDTVVLTGDAMFQTPLGWLADRVAFAACIWPARWFQPVMLALPLILGFFWSADGHLPAAQAPRRGRFMPCRCAGGKTSADRLIMINALFGFLVRRQRRRGPVVNLAC